jgi:hypothetical protein
MSSFRHAVTVTKRTTGTLVDGIYTDAASTSSVIQASVQPAGDSDVQTLPEGRRERKAFRLYTDSELVSLQESENPDRVYLYAEDYEVVTKNPWQNGVINHFKYIVVKI